MLHPNRRSFACGRIVALLILAVCLAAPASAQFGGLKKKLKGEAAAKAGEKAAPEAGAEAPAAPANSAATAPGGGGTIVLTADVVDRLLAGLKAAKADRELALKEDTPYGRYARDRAAYDAAMPKCSAAQQTGIQRIAADPKKNDKYAALTEKMIAAQSKQDYARMAVYQDSALAMIDPSCAVHEPKQPDGYYEMQRDIDKRAEQTALKTADFTPTEFGQVSDRAIAILNGSAPPGDASPAEKAAVSAKDPELKSLLGIRQAQEARVSKAVPGPAPAPARDTAPAPAAPAATATVNDCMVQNVQKHQAEIDALGNRGEAAKNAGNTAGMMAIADSINRIMMAGCTGRQ
jgi:hypothetical protein